MPDFDILRLAQILRDAALAEIRPRFRHLDSGQVKQKTEAIDLVTEADTEAERVIARAVSERWPEALFVGEESVAADANLLSRFDDAEFAIVVDPVDGTANFAAGLPLFATMAAVVQNGETIAGIIYDPMGDDWALAMKGQGAFLIRPDGEQERLTVTTAPDLDQMVGTASIAWLAPESRANVMANLAKVRVTANYRVAGHDYRLFAGGHTHFAAYNKLMPWDHLAGSLIATEAGGHVARFDGQPYRPHHRDGGLLIATDPDAWQVLRDEIFTVD